jgi:shikimate dehydrogenase
MKIDAHTKLYCVLGNPVSHSLSPVMHQAAFSKLFINAAYLAFEVTDIGKAITGLRALGIRGASVTVPHKIAVIDHIDEMEEIARKTGAVNTIVNENGILLGTNTDGAGALSALYEKIRITSRTTYIIGAGGAARAISHALKAEGGQPVIVNRSPEKGKALATELGAEFIPLSRFESPPGSIIVNTTTVGMHPNTDQTPVDKNAYSADTVVMDIVYNPLKTRFLQEAEKKGCTIVDGAAMFIYQGALQFERWTGKKPPLETMKKTVYDALQ